MSLPHGRRQARLKSAVELAKPAIAVAVGVRRAMLLPQQLQRHPRPPQFAMDRSPVRPRPRFLGRDRGRRMSRPSSASSVTPSWQRPAHARAPRPPDAVPGRRRAHPEAGGNLAFGQAGGRQPQHVARCAWVISLQACPAPCGKGAKPCRFADHPTTLVTPVHSWSRSPGTGGRDRSERLVAIDRNAWSRSSGARTYHLSFIFGWTDQPVETLNRIENLATTAIGLDTPICRPTTRLICCCPARPNSTLKKTSGNPCAQIRCRTGSSNRSTISSITAATPGTPSSTSHGGSCRSPVATGPLSVSHCEDWYYPLRKPPVG